MTPLTDYLNKWAEPEGRALAEITKARPNAWTFSVVIPTLGEAIDEVFQLLDSIATLSKNQALCILVVNENEVTSEAYRAANRTVLDRLGFPKHQHQGLLLDEDRNVLVVDRTGVRSVLSHQGVGHARKIGGDIAVACMEKEWVQSDWIRCTDVDASLPSDYFDPLPEDAAGIVFSFCHRATELGEALYDRWLRHYTLGLVLAGSPYGFCALGSAIAIRASAYCSVRGFPKRSHAEDFYLINKIAKIGRIDTLGLSPIQLSSRRSDRTPVGTGTGIQKFEQLLRSGQNPTFYSPECFVALRDFLGLLPFFALHRDLDRLIDEVRERWRTHFGERAERKLGALFFDLSTLTVFQTALQNRPTPLALIRELWSRFDGLWTLKLVHAMSKRPFPEMDWRIAIETLDRYLGTKGDQVDRLAPHPDPRIASHARDSAGVQ